MANHPHMVAAGSGSEPIAMGDLNAHTAICRNVCPTLKCGGDGAMVASETADKIMEANPMLVRRLTPLECERLQGFPDGHTLIGWKGKPAEECPDGPRYKAIGNSMAVPVMRWIGKRIAAPIRIRHHDGTPAEFKGRLPGRSFCQRSACVHATQ